MASRAEPQPDSHISHVPRAALLRATSGCGAKDTPISSLVTGSLA